MKKVRIQLSGCHDTTIITRTVTKSQHSLLLTLEEWSNEESDSECQPTISVEDV